MSGIEARAELSGTQKIIDRIVQTPHNLVVLESGNVGETLNEMRTLAIRGGTSPASCDPEVRRASLGAVAPQGPASPRYAHARPGLSVGPSGLVAPYDSLLSPGLPPAHLRVDSMGRIAGPLQRNDLRSLPTLKLTNDSSLQRGARKAVRDAIAPAHANGHGDSDAGAEGVRNQHTGASDASGSVAGEKQEGEAEDQEERNGTHRDHRRKPQEEKQETQGP